MTLKAKLGFVAATALVVGAVGGYGVASLADRQKQQTDAEREEWFRMRYGVHSAKTVEELKKSLLFRGEWKEAEFRKRKFVFALTKFGGLNEVHGWTYDSYNKEWSRIVLVYTQFVGNAALSVDEKKGVLSLHGIANNEFKGDEVFRFDLRAVSGGSEQTN